MGEYLQKITRNRGFPKVGVSNLGLGISDKVLDPRLSGFAVSGSFKGFIKGVSDTVLGLRAKRV